MHIHTNKHILKTNLNKLFKGTDLANKTIIVMQFLLTRHSTFFKENFHLSIVHSQNAGLIAFFTLDQHEQKICTFWHSPAIKHLAQVPVPSKHVKKSHKNCVVSCFDQKFLFPILDCLQPVDDFGNMRLVRR